MTGVLVIKQINPTKLKEDAMRLALLNPIRKAANDMQVDFKKTTASWQHKVTFEKTVSLAIGGPAAQVSTNDPIYGYVNDGTVPHAIFPKRAKALSFQWGGKGSYRAKTTPGFIGSQPGGPTGPRVAKPYVQHPGTKARAFDEAIKKKWEPMFKRRMEDAMKAAAKASGHSI